MANALFDKGRQGILDRTIDMTAATLKAVFVDGYTPNLATHDNLDDVTGAGGTLVGTPQVLTSKTYTDGVFDAADVTFNAVPLGSATEHILIYVDTGTASTSRLVALDDTATNLPVTPNGGDIVVAWAGSPNFIFKL